MKTSPPLPASPFHSFILYLPLCIGAFYIQQVETCLSFPQSSFPMLTLLLFFSFLSSLLFVSRELCLIYFHFSTPESSCFVLPVSLSSFPYICCTTSFHILFSPSYSSSSRTAPICHFLPCWLGGQVENARGLFLPISWLLMRLNLFCPPSLAPVLPRQPGSPRLICPSSFTLYILSFT